MSEWWSVLAVFWALYLADGVSGGRRERLFLSSWCGGFSWRLSWRKKRGGGPATLTQAGWHFAPPLPWAYTLPLDDLPASFAPEGLTNWPSVATARPAWLPDGAATAKWESLGAVGLNGPWLTLNGRRFAPATATLNAAELKELATRLAPLDIESRAGEIFAWQARRFSVPRARRRLTAALARTRTLAWLNTLQVAGWAVLSAGLLSGRFNPAASFEPVRPGHGEMALQIPWWVLVAALVLTHGLAVGLAWRIHRRLYPKLRDERGSLIFSACLLPAQALRFRAALLRPLMRGMAPLAVVLAAGSPGTARAAAAATWRDLHYPIRPPGLPPDVAAIADAAALLAKPVLARALAEAKAAGLIGLDPQELLAAPTGLGPEVCAYCPRCGDGFVRADGVCPQGMALLKLPGGRD